ncbi:MAG: hypothetical protein GXO48_05505 [Chlorobi bacterium]|nr:hypothetical protein [Chlorobiota bacterium]
MKKLFTLIMVAGLVIGACQSESTEEPVGGEEEKANTESVEQEQPQETQGEVVVQPAETNVSANYEWNNLVEEYNQLWCKYSNDNTPADEKEKIYPRLKELQEELDKIYEAVENPQEKQALYQAMAKMVECK